jgi:hypothetical protein
MATKKKKTSHKGKNRNRYGTEPVQLSVRVPPAEKAWVVKHAEAAGVSNSAFVAMLLQQMRRTEDQMGEPGGLFDMYSKRVEQIIDAAAEANRK